MMRDRITSAGEQTAISAGVKNLISLEASVQTGGKCACKGHWLRRGPRDYLGIDSLSRVQDAAIRMS